MLAENPFRRMLEGWGPERWCKGVMYDMGTSCLMGRAFIVASYVELTAQERDAASQLMYQKVEALFPDRTKVDELKPVPSFNDHPDTTFADVEALLEKCAVAWEEQI